MASEAKLRHLISVLLANAEKGRQKTEKEVNQDSMQNKTFSLLGHLSNKIQLWSDIVLIWMVI